MFWMMNMLQTAYKNILFIVKLMYINYTTQYTNGIMAKLLLNIPCVVGESKIQTYNDIRIKLENDNQWVYMWSLQNPMNNKVLVNDHTECEPFSSYSYLDLLKDDKVQGKAIEAAIEYATGNIGLSHLPITRAFEDNLSTFFYDRENALVSSSGFLACMGTIVAIAGSKDVIIADMCIHSSIRTGIKLARLNGTIVKFFAHNDFNEAEKYIQTYKHATNIYLVMESVYSMDGDIGNFPAAVSLKNKYNIKIILDESHGLGTIGHTGRGAEDHFELPNEAWLIFGSLTKSLASTGGYVVGDDDVIKFLQFHSLANKWTAQLSAYHVAAANTALNQLKADPAMVHTLQNNAQMLRDQLINVSNGFKVGGVDGCVIIPVIFHDNTMRVLTLATKLLEAGYLVSAVVAPDCPLESPRLRITATSGMTAHSIDRFCSTLASINAEIQESVPFTAYGLREKVIHW
jgi:7-keto-8-aminopelargonate synthetase-like enzyme